MSSVQSCSISHTPLQRRDRARESRAGRTTGKGPISAEGRVPRTRTREEQGLTEAKLSALARRLGAEPFPLDNPCIDDGCARTALDRFFTRLEKLDREGEGAVRILHLGDSHVAADYITGTVRRALHDRFGSAGRGFMAVDQRIEYGGRRLHRNGWRRTRIVDHGESRNPFGFSGMCLESRREGARVDFQVEPGDAAVTIFHHADRNGTRIKVLLDDALIGEINTESKEDRSSTRSIAIPRSERGGRGGVLSLVASGAGAKVFGLSFEAKRPGIFYDAIGPVGADARVYLSLNQKSFRQHLAALAPHLVVVMVGGNDALMMRKGLRTLDDVRTDHERIIDAIQAAVPDADCMLWSPMDAGEIIDGRIVSKRYISEVRNMQRAAATARGCAFWDMFESMGANGSFRRWHDAGIMNDDLVHPRATAGELLGHLFAISLVEAYSKGG